MKNTIAGIIISLGSAGLIAQLMGFLPSQIHSQQEWRSTLNRDSGYALIPLATSGQYRQITDYRLPITKNGPEDLETGFSGSQIPINPLALLHIDGNTVSLMSNSGPIPVPFSPAVLEAMHIEEALNEKPGLPICQALYSSLDQNQALPALNANRLDHQELINPPALQRPILLEPQRLIPASVRSADYRRTVEQYAPRYNLDTSLILAIIQTESSFNPNLISSRNAHGLMQIVPEAAGNEVHRYLGRTETLTESTLLNPETNIRYGITYLHLLRAFHLNGIENPLSLEYCTIAAYNGGSGRLLRYFGPDKDQAVATINSMTPQEVLDSLLTGFPYAETRSYLSKVLDTRSRYITLASN